MLRPISKLVFLNKYYAQSCLKPCCSNIGFNLTMPALKMSSVRFVCMTLQGKALQPTLIIYAEPKIREPLYFMKSLSDVTSTCGNTCMTPGDDMWRPHPIMNWTPYLFMCKCVPYFWFCVYYILRRKSLVSTDTVCNDFARQS